MSVRNSEDTVPVSREQYLIDLRNTIKFHASLGIEVYPRSEELHRFIELTDRGKISVLSGLLNPPENNRESGAVKSKLPDGEDLECINREAANCSRCHLFEKKQGSIPGGGNQSCSLMIVGDWSRQQKRNFSERIFFGLNEDVMLWKMMAAIGLKPEDIYVTNCLKCCPGEGVRPDEASEKSCFSFLEREIALTNPKIICAMGEVATKALTGSSKPLARLRGKFIKYRYQAQHPIYVIPTYHPEFLLKHQEMKKATWHDLQAIQKSLAV